MGARRKPSILSTWLARLSAEKAAVYEPSARELEAGYDVLSIALDDGLQRQEAGDWRGARTLAGLCGELAERHAMLLCGALGTMERRSRHFGKLPEVTPLDEETFRTDAARSSCFWNRLMHRVLFSARSRWFHKLHTLGEILDEVRAAFLHSAREIADGVSVSPPAEWERLERTHDDWNTCLRETVVLLKCLLTTLAPAEVEELRRELEEQRRRLEERPSEWLGTEEATEESSHHEGRPYV
ncbi:MAG TPA: hypothetical protein VJW51_13965 [Candidatus Acidoferrales bacterium]|nr:hypothetical protein [Candidatus Acidoferrales bacterium]